MEKIYFLIDYLCQKSDQITQLQSTVEKLYSLKSAKQTFNGKTFEGKRKQEEMQKKIDEIWDDKIKPINDAMIAEFEKVGIYIGQSTIKNKTINTVDDFKDTLTNDTVKTTKLYLKRYIAFRNTTKDCTIGLDYYFKELDESLEDLYLYVESSPENEFNQFKRKPFFIVLEAMERHKTPPPPKPLPDLLNTERVKQSNTIFVDRINGEGKADVLAKLHTFIDGKKGKNVALIIRAAIAKGLITKPTFREVANEFGDIGNKAGYNNYMRYQFTEEELTSISSQL